MYQEKQTSHYIQQVLGELDISYSVGWGRNTRRRPLSSAKNSISGGDVNSTTTDEDIRFIEGPGGYGVVTDLGTGEEPCVLLRADIDALPILEQTSGVEEFASQNKGRMHACGHDGHTAMLLGAAAVLKSMEGSIPGTVRLVFQPAEEGGAGAKRMIEEGVLSQKPRVSHAFAMHVWPTLPSGTVGGRPGPLLAACERFELVIQGIGGHAAMPHLTVSRADRVPKWGFLASLLFRPAKPFYSAVSVLVKPSLSLLTPRNIDRPTRSWRGQPSLWACKRSFRASLALSSRLW
jgi:IAA-amino acid hydrolase